MIPTSIRNRILDITGASSIRSIDTIQPLWNNYGSLLRIFLDGSEAFEAVILKYIQIPKELKHPKGFANSRSNQRKVRSYEVEACWYNHFNTSIAISQSPTPIHLGSWQTETGTCILLEDLNRRGYSNRLYHCTSTNIRTVLHWLAHFHAANLNVDAKGLWECGTYWHLDTRPDELREIEGTLLHTFAPFIDAQLSTTQFQTILHGDAKLANFCFNEKGDAVAAVDFQYVGQGCGMKDLAYFISSCMTEKEAKESEAYILGTYFEFMRTALAYSEVDFDRLEEEWRALYPVAIADFQRFILGWSPSHYKNTSTADQITESVMDTIHDDLLKTAIHAAQTAGQFVRSKWQGEFKVQSKGFGSAAADIVTEVDEAAQDIIYDILQPTLERYNLGWLAEEGHQDNSRLHTYAFWTVDPIDGTLFFSEGKEGFAVSIALVDRTGKALLGVIYDPANDVLYETAFDGSVYMNEATLTIETPSDAPITLVLDRGFEGHPWFPVLSSHFNIVFVGGAVMNVVHTLRTSRAFYMKVPKKRLGGCAIWDLAAASIMVQNAGGSAQFFDGKPLHLNRSDRLYFNDVGFIFCGARCTYTEIKNALIDLGLIQDTSPIHFNLLQ